MLLVFDIVEAKLFNLVIQLYVLCNSLLYLLIREIGYLTDSKKSNNNYHSTAYGVDLWEKNLEKFKNLTSKNFQNSSNLSCRNLLHSLISLWQPIFYKFSLPKSIIMMGGQKCCQNLTKIVENCLNFGCFWRSYF